MASYASSFSKLTLCIANVTVLQVTVILDMNDAFEMILTSNEINATENQQSVSVPSEDGKTVQFPIKPKQLGEIPIKVTAISSAASDAIIQKVLVKVDTL